jgi:hypothetical protein
MSVVFTCPAHIFPLGEGTAQFQTLVLRWGQLLDAGEHPIRVWPIRALLVQERSVILLGPCRHDEREDAGGI